MSEEKEHPQDQWRRKCLELKTDDETSSPPFRGGQRWLARELRKLADHIENKRSYPRVFGCSIPEQGVNYPGTMEEYRVILSHPWGG